MHASTAAAIAAQHSIMGRVISQVAYGSAAYDSTLALRDEVMRQPLGLNFTDEELQRDRTDFHLACHEDGQLVGCLVLSPLGDNDVQMRQVAVLPRLQGQSIGRDLVQFAEYFARRRGYSTMTLHARDTAIPFYEKLGYNRIGEPFEQVTITHWEMTKPL
jgi:ribosomal protein S18 acetylase RimI-like enzyme